MPIVHNLVLTRNDTRAIADHEPAPPDDPMEEPLISLDPTWLAAQRSSCTHRVQLHEAAAASAPPERALDAWAAVANDRGQLLGLEYAAGAPADELRRLLVAAARAQVEVVQRRGLAVGEARPEQLATGHSRGTYLAICMALAAGDQALARTLAPYVWEPPGAAYIAAGSVLCTPEQQLLAEALKQSLLGRDDDAAVLLARIRRVTGDTVGELLMLRGVVERNAPRFLDGLGRQLAAHAELAAEIDDGRNVEWFLCLPALGLAALALDRGLVTPEQLCPAAPHFPRDLISPPTGRSSPSTRTIAAQVARFLAHPPMAVKDLASPTTELADYLFDGHGEAVNVTFKLRCPCGGAEFIAYHEVDQADTEGQLTVTCDRCGAARVVHDPRRHGFDGVTCGASIPGSTGTAVALECGEVEAPYELFIRFEYSLDGDPGFAGHESELYSWITLVGWVDCMGAWATLYDSECA